MRVIFARIPSLLAALGLLLAFTLNGHAASRCAAPAGFANPMLLESMGRGVNLPGWDSPDPQRRPTEAQLRALAKDGFTHIRLLVEDPPVTDAGQGAFAQRLFDQLVMLLSLGYSVSIDLHAGYLAEPYLAQGPDQARRYLAGIWRRIAPVVRVFDSQKVAVELLNEPPTDAATWREAAAGLISDLRRILPNNTIVVGPAGPQRHEALADMQPFNDNNIVYAVHYYDPFLFTHQGANWDGPNDPLQYFHGLPFPADASDPAVQANIKTLRANGRAEVAGKLEYALDDPWTEQEIANAFDTLAAWGKANTAPVIVNEFGVLTFTAPRASRLKWLAAVRRAAQARCIGWTHWDFQDGFGLMDPDTGMPDQGVIDALMPPGE